VVVAVQHAAAKCRWHALGRAVMCPVARRRWRAHVGIGGLTRDGRRDGVFSESRLRRRAIVRRRLSL
jgi:hypothetical protein